MGADRGVVGGFNHPRVPELTLDRQCPIIAFRKADRFVVPVCGVVTVGEGRIDAGRLWEGRKALVQLEGRGNSPVGRSRTEDADRAFKVGASSNRLDDSKALGSRSAKNGLVVDAISQTEAWSQSAIPPA